jgi:hypothetical protein
MMHRDDPRAPGSAHTQPQAPLDHFNDFQAYVTDPRCMPASSVTASQIKRTLEFTRSIKGVRDRGQLLAALLVSVAIEAHYAGYSMRDVAMRAVDMLHWTGGESTQIARDMILSAIARSNDRHDSQVRTYAGPGIVFEQHADQILSVEEETRER